MQKLILYSKNSGIVSKDELHEFAIDLKESLDTDVEFYTPKSVGTQATFNDVVEIWIILDRISKTEAGKKIKEKIEDKVIDIILNKFIEWAKKRMRGEKKNDQNQLRYLMMTRK